MSPGSRRGESGLGEGLPRLSTPSASEAVVSTDEVAATNPPRVLLVEDDEGITKVLRISLAAAGFEVSGVTTGADALRLLDQRFAQAVVLDLGLPDSFGGAVLERLRQLEPRDLPVWVVMSALDRREATRHYGCLGPHFFAKPFDPWDLVRTLEQLLSERCETADPGTGIA